MAHPNPNIAKSSGYRQLDDSAINRIAAGEVVERPCLCAVKEAVGNAIDAGCPQIRFEYADGGQTLIRSRDDARHARADLVALALSRHATPRSTERPA